MNIRRLRAKVKRRINLKQKTGLRRSSKRSHKQQPIKLKYRSQSQKKLKWNKLDSYV